MNKIFFIAISLLFFSCSDENDLPEILESLSIADLSSKWTFNELDDIKSIEFNESNSFIVVSEIDQEQEVDYGTYEIQDKNIILDGYGVLEDYLINGREIKFTLKRNNQEDLGLEGDRQEDIIVSTESLDYLFRTWNLVSVGGNSVEGTDDAAHVFISKAGTYFVKVLNVEDADFLSYWNWKNLDDSIFCFSHFGETDCSDDKNQSQIMELNSSDWIFNDIDRDEINVLEAL